MLVVSTLLLSPSGVVGYGTPENRTGLGHCPFTIVSGMADRAVFLRQLDSVEVLLGEARLSVALGSNGDLLGVNSDEALIRALLE